jgi:succinate dehydrogenase / fumarate reductase membrane anchor subunit
MVSPVRPVSSARAGFMGWLWQRISALYLSGFSIYLALSFSLAPLSDHVAWKQWFSNGAVRLAWALFILNLLLHAWIGLRNVYMDYLHPLWLRFSVSALTALGLMALGLWAAQILLEAAAT